VLSKAIAAVSDSEVKYEPRSVIWLSVNLNPPSLKFNVPEEFVNNVVLIIQLVLVSFSVHLLLEVITREQKLAFY